MLEQYLESRLRVDLTCPSTRARCRRVLLLVALIAILSVGDLLVTLTMLNSLGMEEVNPFAAFIIRQQSPVGLVLFKIGSVLGCVSIILVVRHRRQGEVAAWIAAGILTVLTVRWSAYTSEVANFNSTITIGEAQRSQFWLTFGNRRLESAPLP